MAVELVDPRRALEVVPRDLRLPCCDRWRVPVVVVVGVGCLGRNLAPPATLTYPPLSTARPSTPGPSSAPWSPAPPIPSRPSSAP